MIGQNGVFEYRGSSGHGHRVSGWAEAGREHLGRFSSIFGPKVRVNVFFLFSPKRVFSDYKISLCVGVTSEIEYFFESVPPGKWVRCESSKEAYRLVLPAFHTSNTLLRLRR